ncbi:MAG: DUF2782 domain-containing protein [Nitrosomonas sp.]
MYNNEAFSWLGIHMHRFILTLLLLSFPLLGTAQTEQSKDKEPKKSMDHPSHPKNLIPLPEPEPPELSESQSDPELEEQVTIIKRGEDTIEEHRVNGELLMIKVIPRIGPPYYLKKNTIVDHHAHPNSDAGGPNVSPPMWQFFKF